MYKRIVGAYCSVSMDDVKEMIFWCYSLSCVTVVLIRE